jgi:hypothetical protein
MNAHHGVGNIFSQILFSSLLSSSSPFPFLYLYLLTLLKLCKSCQFAKFGQT